MKSARGPSGSYGKENSYQGLYKTLKFMIPLVVRADRL